MMFLRLLPCLLALYFSLGAASCDVPVDAFPVKGQSCTVADDQDGGFAARVRALPIRVVIDREFSKDQHLEISKAIAQWNKFSQASLGLDFYMIVEAGNRDYSHLPMGAAYCAQGTARQAGVLVRREDSQHAWESDDGENEAAAGVTRRCRLGSETEQSEQLVVLNTASGDSDRLFSVTLHEFGHVLGLGHSCTNNKDAVSKYYRSCEKLRAGDTYYDAVMFPSLTMRYRSGTGSSAGYTERKEVLRANDMERAFCLYTGQTRLDRLREKSSPGPYRELGY